MKTKLPAFALFAILTGNAQAQAQTQTQTQSDVTLFGVIDAGILSQTNNSSAALGYLPNHTNTGNLLALKDGGIGQSYWGIKGDEDLGGGMSASFNLQGNFQSPNGTAGGNNSAGGTSLFNQQANVGLSGSLGSVQMGRVVSPIYFAFASTDVRGGGYFGSVLTALVGVNSATGSFSGGNSNASIATIYNDNAVVYTSPEWQGVTANLEYAIGGVAGDTSAMRQEAFTLRYSGAGLKLDALYYDGNDDGVRAAVAPKGVNTNRLVSVGGLYTFDDISASAAYFKGTNPSNTGAGVNPAALGGAVTSGNLDLTSLGLGYRATPQVNITSGAYFIHDLNNSGNKSTMVALGLNYSLSKRTTLYIEGAHVSNEGSNMSQGAVYGSPVTAGIANKAVMLGMRHAF